MKSTFFVDNTTTTGKQYFYTIKAVDNSLNRSVYSNEASATATGNKDLVAHFLFEGNTMDSTMNLNHSAPFGGISYLSGKVSSQTISLNGTDAFIQLPANLLNHQEITISMWVYWRSITSGQHLFDFGNDLTQYMYLTPKSSLSQLRFAIKNGGSEQSLTATALPYFKRSHIAVTLSASGVHMYVNGVQVSESNAITISPMDFKPILNYIGRSQSSDPLFNGNIDDFRVYNYALAANEIAQISGIVSDVSVIEYNDMSLWPVPANDFLNIKYSTGNNNRWSTLTMFDMYGRVVMSKDIKYALDSKLDVSNLPSGIYMLKMTSSNESIMKKIIIKH